MPRMITAVVPVSPIKSHPGTDILVETLGSIRYHLPDAELFVTFDGVRPEQEDLRADYDEHIRRVLWLLDHYYGNALPFLFDEHHHQTGMMRSVLDHVETPLILYVEQDAPLVVDEPIDWDLVSGYITGGKSNLVRFHHEAHIPPDHKHLMHGWELDFTQTSQWSQRPHLASTAYYRRIMESYFSPKACSFIEDKMHSVAQEAFKIDGMGGWNQHRLHIYTPPGNIKRSYHLDGRAGGPKFDDEQVF